MAQKLTIAFDYDQDTDVLHVTFGTGEPSFGEEVDDQLVVEYGMFTGALTGFQLLNVKRAELDAIQSKLTAQIRDEILKRQREALQAVASERDQLLRQAIESLPAQLSELVAKN